MHRTDSACWLLVVLAGLTLAPRCAFGQPQERPPLPDYLAASIPEAIDRGKSYLMRNITNTGTWAKAGEGNAVGYAALPALTLLELGVPGNDAVIQAAARFVRASVPSDKLTSTYEVALALLFLDRLSEKNNDKKTDRANIETLAGRIIAAQTPTGGWSYQVQYLNAKDTEEILGLVRKLEPLPLHHLLAGRIPNMTNPFVKRDPVSPGELTMKRTVTVPKRFVLLPCFTQFGTYPLVDPDGKNNPPPFLSPTDNSTTQFALLALWAARRHNIPVTRTGAMAFMRFHTSQSADGGWSYPYRFGGAGATATMIAPGLLGLAVGHGIVKEKEFKQLNLKDVPVVDEDPRVLNGFKALSAHVGEPLDRVKDVPYPNMYFLWGLERVCVLYGVEAVGNKDWYRWGAEALVANQEGDGSWFKKDNYPGAAPALDTSFALMFLKRANLAQDLSNYLKFSPKKLNEGVIKLAPPPPPPPPETKVEAKKPELKPEPPKAEAKKPDPAPVQVAEAKPPTPQVQSPPSGMRPSPPPVVQAAPESVASVGVPIWVWIVIGLGVVLIVGGLVAFFVFSGGNDGQEDDEEEHRPRKKKKRR